MNQGGFGGGQPPGGYPPGGGGGYGPPPGGGYPAQGGYGQPQQPQQPQQGGYGGYAPQGAPQQQGYGPAPGAAPQGGYGPAPGAAPQGGYGAPPGAPQQGAWGGQQQAQQPGYGPPPGAFQQQGYGAPQPAGALASGSVASLSFEGEGGEFFGKMIGGYLLTMITFGIYAPWFICSLTSYLYEKTNIQTARGPVRVSFRGEGGSLFGVLFVSYLLTAITFGIYAPWAICKVTRYFSENTYFQTSDGRTYQLRFTGEGGALFGTWIVNALLMWITLYIYTPWAVCKLRKWFYERTQIVENGQPVGQLDFVGDGGSLFGTWLVGAILTGITFGIYASWFWVNMTKYFNQNTRVMLHGRTYSADFVGQGGDLFVIRLVNGLLTGITFGIYWFWGFVKERKWVDQNTVFRALN